MNRLCTPFLPYIVFSIYYLHYIYFFQDVIRRRRSRKSDAGFSLTFAAFAGLIGVLIGLLMSLIFPRPQAAA